MIVATALAVATVILIGFAVGYGIGLKKGYIAALDDARLGKPAKYKLVKTAEKWVEVGK
jgi:hypothetical protein